MPRKTLKQRIETRIAGAGAAAFGRADFADLGGYDQVGRALRALVDEGRLCHAGRGVFALSTTAAFQPVPSFSRTWSAPSGVNDNVLIASVVARPTFDDLLLLSLRYGVSRLRTTARRMRKAGDIKPQTAAKVCHFLDNIAAGFRDAHRRAA